MPRPGRKSIMQPASLLSNHLTVEVLQRLLFSEDKPSKLTPLDVAVLSYLVLRRCQDHEIFDSQFTLATRLCAETKAVARSLKRLALLKWITLINRGKGRTKGVALNVDKFPALQPVRDRITDEARWLAREYVKELVKVEPRRIFPKGWVDRQFPSAQRILTACGGDVQLAYSMMGFAFMNRDLMKRARKSIYNLLTIWPMVTRAYKARVQEISAAKGGQSDECNQTQAERSQAA